MNTELRIIKYFITNYAYLQIETLQNNFKISIIAGLYSN